jgi:hypothetical protein
MQLAEPCRCDRFDYFVQLNHVVSYAGQCPKKDFLLLSNIGPLPQHFGPFLESMKIATKHYR